MPRLKSSRSPRLKNKTKPKAELFTRHGPVDDIFEKGTFPMVPKVFLYRVSHLCAELESVVPLMLCLVDSDKTVSSSTSGAIYKRYFQFRSRLHEFAAMPFYFRSFERQRAQQELNKNPQEIQSIPDAGVASLVVPLVTPSLSMEEATSVSVVEKGKEEASLDTENNRFASLAFSSFLRNADTYEVHVATLFLQSVKKILDQLFVLFQEALQQASSINSTTFFCVYFKQYDRALRCGQLLDSLFAPLLRMRWQQVELPVFQGITFPLLEHVKKRWCTSLLEAQEKHMVHTLADCFVYLFAAASENVKIHPVLLSELEAGKGVISIMKKVMSSVSVFQTKQLFLKQLKIRLRTHFLKKGGSYASCAELKHIRQIADRAQQIAVKIMDEEASLAHGQQDRGQEKKRNHQSRSASTSSNESVRRGALVGASGSGIGEEGLAVAAASAAGSSLALLRASSVGFPLMSTGDDDKEERVDELGIQVGMCITSCSEEASQLGSMIYHPLIGTNCEYIVGTLPVALSACEMGKPASFEFVLHVMTLTQRCLDMRVNFSNIRLILARGLRDVYARWQLETWKQLSSPLSGERKSCKKGSVFLDPSLVLAQSAMIYVQSMLKFFELVVSLSRACRGVNIHEGQTVTLRTAVHAVYVNLLNSKLNATDLWGRGGEKLPLHGGKPFLFTSPQLFATGIHMCMCKASWYYSVHHAGIAAEKKAASKEKGKGVNVNQQTREDANFQLLELVYQLTAMFDDIADKETASNIYARDLATRLASGLSLSIAWEEQILAQLRPNFSVASMAILTRMMDDIAESNQLNKNYSPPHTLRDVRLEMLVLSEANWPLRQPRTENSASQWINWRNSHWNRALVTLFPIISGFHSTFSQYYRKHAPGRTLNWLVEYSRGVIEITAARGKDHVKKVTVRCTGPQLAILIALVVQSRKEKDFSKHLQMESSSSSKSWVPWVSLTQVCEAIHFDKKERAPSSEDVYVVLNTLVRSRLIQFHAEKEMYQLDLENFVQNSDTIIKENDTKRKSKPRTIPINRLHPPNLSMEFSPLVDIRLCIQACIVRLLKKLKKVDESKLLRDVIREGGWHGDDIVVKQCLEIVIDKGFAIRNKIREEFMISYVE